MTDAMALVDRAIDLSDAEAYAAAIALLDEAIRLEPGNAQAWFERGMALMGLDRDADAVRDFDQALALEEDYPGARDWRARALATLGKHGEAAEERLAELRRNPDGPYEGMGVSPQAWADCARAFIAAGDPEMARALLEEYFAGPVEQVTAYACHCTAPMRMLARLWYEAGEEDAAFMLASETMEEESRCPADEELYGVLLARRGRIEEAQAIYASLIEGLPPDVDYAEELKAALEGHG